MKKLIYLIVAIAAFGLIVSGCIPVVPPTEQSEPTNLTRGPDATYYVAKTGSDSNVGDQDNPWLTISYAISQAAPTGDTIIVYPGTYNEEVEIAKALTLQGIGLPTIEAPYGANSNAIWIGASDVTVTGFELKAPDDIVDINPYNLSPGVHINNVVIEGNYVTPTEVVYDTVAPGIFACRVDNLTVRDNVIKNTGGCGIFLGLWPGGGTNPVANSLIEYNTIDNTGYTGILAYDTTGGGITIRYNTISDVGYLPTRLDDGIRAGAFGSGLTIECNDIYGSSRNGIQINHDAASHTIHFNNIYNNSQYGLKNIDAGTVDAINNWWGHPGGPRRPAGNSGKISGPKDADQVSENVLYHPWLSGTNSVSNIALDQAATASATYQSYTATMAVDGDYNTLWNAGAHPPQWIEIDLGKWSTVVGFRLLTAQSPVGETTHVVFFSDDGDVIAESTFSGYTENKQWLEAWFDALLHGVKTLRVTTTVSPSWVAWYEIEVYGWQ